MQYIFTHYASDYHIYEKAKKGINDKVEPDRVEIQKRYGKNLYADLKKSLSELSYEFKDIEFKIGIGQGKLTFNPYIILKRKNTNFDISTKMVII